MVLSGEVWGELIELGVLSGDETCALCGERPVLLIDVARAPILLCPAHANATLRQLQTDLQDSAVRPAVA